MNGFARPARLGRLTLVVALALSAGAADSNDGGRTSLRVAYPKPDEVVTYAAIPIWLRGDDPTAFSRMQLKLNAAEISREFLPGSKQGKKGYHALAIVALRPGLNRIELASGERTQRVEFRYKPHPMRARIRVLEGGKPLAARVSFRGLGDTPDPVLAPMIWKKIARAGDKFEHTRNFVYTHDGMVQVPLPEGDYEVLVSRGPAYSMARTVVGPDSGPIELEITRVVNTRGWISADFHVHAMPSHDSGLPLWDRVVSFLAQDVDVIVASDHNSITDYRADLPSNHAWPEPFEAVPGVEADLPVVKRGSAAAGHWNFWPLVREEGADALTRIRFPEVASVPELYQAYRTHNSAAHRERFGDTPVVIQLNHPRGMQFYPGASTGRVHGHLSRANYDPGRPLSADSNGKLLARSTPDSPRSIDVDSIELLNRLAFGLYLEVRQDWFAWIAQGFVPAGTANTDSHALVITEAGFPRNWVRHDGELPVDAASLARAVRQRQIVGSTGPLIELAPWSDDGSPLHGSPGHLEVTVRSAAWMPVQEIRVYVGGELAQTVPLKRKPIDPFARSSVAHTVEVPLSIDRDTFVVVEAGDSIERLLDPEPRSGPLGRAFPAVGVLAFTNPLLIDADEDGSWEPPGL